MNLGGKKGGRKKGMVQRVWKGFVPKENPAARTRISEGAGSHRRLMTFNLLATWWKDGRAASTALCSSMICTCLYQHFTHENDEAFRLWLDMGRAAINYKEHRYEGSRGMVEDG